MAQIHCTMTQVRLTMRNSGLCWAKAHHTMKGAPKTDIRFYATWAELSHPSEGTVLFDTGYTSRFHAATARFPNSIYARMTKVEIEASEEAIAQVNGPDVRHILLSHLHADHIGGLRDFPDAQCWASAGWVLVVGAHEQFCYSHLVHFVSTISEPCPPSLLHHARQGCIG